MIAPSIDVQKTGDNIRTLMDEKGFTVKQITEMHGCISVKLVYKWRNGSDLPTLDNMYFLSKVLETPMDKIIVPKY